MSFCRWSSDNWTSDLYCYESDEGYVTHVAGNRLVGAIPPTPPLGSVPADEWLAAHRAQAQFLDRAPRASIGLPYDGQCFVDADLGALLTRVEQLAALGYRVPCYVPAAIRAELSEESIQRQNFASSGTSAKVPAVPEATSATIEQLRQWAAAVSLPAASLESAGSCGALRDMKPLAAQ